VIHAVHDKDNGGGGRAERLTGHGSPVDVVTPIGSVAPLGTLPGSSDLHGSFLLSASLSEMCGCILEKDIPQR
jgi:arginine repressor